VRNDDDPAFVYLTGAGSDGSGRGRFSGRAGKGRIEMHFLRLPFRPACMVRMG